MNGAADSAPASGDEPDFGLRRDFYTFAPETLAQDLPEFELGREVGKGSMGIVFEARVLATGQRIALKVLPPSLTLTERALARFLREGRIMARVRHPDIVGFVDQGSRGRLHWFAMDFVDGVTLEERLRVGPLPVQKACAIAAKVGRALQFAHDHGVVHRDIKPGNIMLRDTADPGGEPRIAITDFGLARETGTGSMTDSGAIVGTPMFMAPEVVLGGTGEAGTLADVYSLGASLYALVTGTPPFDGPTAQSVLKAVLAQDPMSPRRRRADLPEAVEAIIGKAMARDPARRYGSALELAEDLERFLRGERVLARRPGVLQRGLRWCAQRPLITALMAAVLLLLIGSLLLVQERHRTNIERDLAQAERLLALASTERNDQDRPRSATERRDLLLAAVAAASAMIARDDGQTQAWFVRARAHHRLQQYAAAIFDLDMAERLHGAPIAELLHFRIDALRHQPDADARRRLQVDLTTLLELDPSPHTRALVAEHLLDYAAGQTGNTRADAVARVQEMLGQVRDDDPRAAVARARALELSGATEQALTAIRSACTRHDGNPSVHLQAAAMFDRHGLYDEGAREHELARRLQPEGAAPPVPPPVDVDGFGKFLGDVDRVLRTLDGRGEPQPVLAPPLPTEPEPKRR
ncbi:MAG: serine/threonine protein kinase [Planctomycetes bacterium]|nr:serine/threonine protein kinase [Planctomycetota bacterium]